MKQVSSTKEIKERPPIVAIMGHIDHGKSSLIDYIRKSNIAEKEAGGITQHVSAYEVLYKIPEGEEKKITFVDTPGHEAFTSIRERGSSTADIVVLVVSAEDGVKPQTLEARDHINNCKTPFIVAITKIDKPSADIERTKQSLAENNIYIEGYGGDVPCVALSSKTGQGVDDLLEMITLLSQVSGFSTNEESLGKGVIIEASLDPRRGISATAVVKDGVVRRGEIASTKGAIAPLRLVLNTAGNNVEEVRAGSPLVIVGWDNLPEAGREFRVFLKKSEAEEFASSIVENEERKLVSNHEMDENGIFLPLVIKADTSGSLEAIRFELEKLKTQRISPRIISYGIGNINENDIKTALSAEDSIVIGFNSEPDNRAKALAERSSIPIYTSGIIYELIDQINKILIERTPMIEVEEMVGRGKILKIFGATRDKQVIGARVLEGEFRVGLEIKIFRREAEIGKGKVRELQQAKVVVDKVTEGAEFGSLIESKTEIAPGDILEAFTKVTK